MSNLTIKQVRHEQVQAQEKIRKTLNDFQSKTGTKVEGIHFEKLQALGQPSEIRTIEIEVQI